MRNLLLFIFLFLLSCKENSLPIQSPNQITSEKMTQELMPTLERRHGADLTFVIDSLKILSVAAETAKIVYYSIPEQNLQTNLIILAKNTERLQVEEYSTWDIWCEKSGSCPCLVEGEIYDGRVSFRCSCEDCVLHVQEIK